MATIVTANSGSADSVVLHGVGRTHGRRFFFYAEIDEKDPKLLAASDITIQGESVGGIDDGWRLDLVSYPGIKALNRARSHYMIYLQLRLPPGVWVLKLMADAHVAAQRPIEVRDRI